MASVVTTSTEIVAVARFTDDDTRTITIPNPKEEITQEEITTFETAASKVLIGDRTGAAFSDLMHIKKREIVKTETAF